jgi:hypothetical protein
MKNGSDFPARYNLNGASLRGHTPLSDLFDNKSCTIKDPDLEQNNPQKDYPRHTKNIKIIHTSPLTN